ncbi:hypothetical protein TBR22_A18580 [Luteitalea sp. TBR-22]|uniref:DUF4136 domain-containing protein n=1 Tax=Luteitalea sp. TBR-22 TaxID=2802971 RepID=UPI001AF32538|nr:DUF4136 domain-containing protein [Luteitalea sp. TBR-22]BCS32644.1 hypothetical protein TBR22_A18580 [Luteitalea sp. TBR-22]
MSRGPSSLVLAVLLLGAGTALAQSVRTDHDPDADFRRYATFMWLKEPSTSSPLINQRITDAVVTGLTARGLRLVAADADLAIAVHTATEQAQTLHTFYTDIGGDWEWRGSSFGSATTSSTSYTVGTLVLDIFDASSRKAIWRGTGMKVLSEDPKKRSATIVGSVEKMLQDYPPSRDARRR